MLLEVMRYLTGVLYSMACADKRMPGANPYQTTWVDFPIAPTIVVFKYTFLMPTSIYIEPVGVRVPPPPTAHYWISELKPQAHFAVVKYLTSHNRSWRVLVILLY